MRVEVRYLDRLPGIGLDSYAFEAPEGTVVGEQFLDGDKVMQVVALHSSYAGPVRALGWWRHQPLSKEVR